MSMTDTGKDNDLAKSDEPTEAEAAEVAKRAQYGQTGDMVDTTIGNMGGAGASATGPDIAEQSKPAIGNHGDLPAGSR